MILRIDERYVIGIRNLKEALLGILVISHRHFSFPLPPEEGYVLDDVSDSALCLTLFLKRVFHFYFILPFCPAAE